MSFLVSLGPRRNQPCRDCFQYHGGLATRPVVQKSVRAWYLLSCDTMYLKRVMKWDSYPLHQATLHVKVLWLRGIYLSATEAKLSIMTLKVSEAWTKPLSTRRELLAWYVSSLTSRFLAVHTTNSPASCWQELTNSNKQGTTIVPNTTTLILWCILNWQHNSFLNETLGVCIV